MFWGACLHLCWVWRDTRGRGVLWDGLNREGPGARLVGLERLGGVLVYALSDLTALAFQSYGNPRNFTGDPALGTAGDLGPEGLLFISADDSPNGEVLQVVSHEVSGSTVIFEVLRSR